MKNQIRSKLYIFDVVKNTNAHKASQEKYFQCYVEVNGLVWKAALFTDSQVRIALNRAKKNPEDILPMSIVPHKASFLQRLKFLFKGII